MVPSARPLAVLAIFLAAGCGGSIGSDEAGEGAPDAADEAPLADAVAPDADAADDGAAMDAPEDVARDAATEPDAHCAHAVAAPLFTALNRFFVASRDTCAGTCVVVVAVESGEPSAYDIPPSHGWTVERAWTGDSPGACADPNGPAPPFDGGVLATGGTGTLEVEAADAGWPLCTVTLHASFELDGGTAAQVDVVDLPIGQGCP